MTILGNIDNRQRNRYFTFGDVQDSRGTLAFDLPKIKGQGALIFDIDHQPTYYVLQPCISTACIQRIWRISCSQSGVKERAQRSFTFFDQLYTNNQIQTAAII